VRRYRVESSVVPDGQVVFRLMPRDEHKDVVFYLACGPGFPDKAPVAFLVVRGDRYPLLSPALDEWTADKWLYEVGDDLVKWQVKLLDQQVAAAEEAIEQGNYKDASDRLAMVLLINPRMPGAARLLARAESEMSGESDA
jgi:Arc/MetJ-type ribon-helix-helix transcriptional regulator